MHRFFFTCVSGCWTNCWWCVPTPTTVKRCCPGVSYRRTYSTGRCAPELLVHVVTVVPNTTIRCEIMCLRMHTSYVKHVVLLCDCIWLLGARLDRPHAVSALCCDTAREEDCCDSVETIPSFTLIDSVNMSSIQYLVSPFNSVPAELREITLFRDLWRTVAACCRSNVASDRTLSLRL